ncbi:acyltransferase [Streptococcus marimammalium]|uniref:acyltransferase n=1 Tax=Streptococcus marimammalium TaxID=269666 RepID=UPI00035FD654|nr:acyltransferase family protein [Streptococcus marimammalium]
MKSRIVSLDIIKLLASICVLLLHVSFKSFTIQSDFSINEYIYYIGTVGIPLFFITNGYFLLNKEKITIRYILKKIVSILFITSFWSLLFYLVRQRFTDNLLLEIITSFVQKGYFFQFWFFGALIVIYISLPILKRIVRSLKIHIFLVMLFLVIGSFIQLFNLVSGAKPVQMFIIQTFRFWTWYSYYLIGGLIGRKEIQNFLTKKVTKLFKFLTLTLFMFMPFLLSFISKYYHGIVYAEYYYDSFFVKLVATMIFLCFLSTSISNKYKLLLSTFSSLTVGVFIIHYHILNFLTRFLDFSDSLINFIGLFLVIFLSFLISFLISKIPFLEKIIRL